MFHVKHFMVIIAHLVYDNKKNKFLIDP